MISWWQGRPPFYTDEISEEAKPEHTQTHMLYLKKSVVDDVTDSSGEMLSNNVGTSAYSDLIR